MIATGLCLMGGCFAQDAASQVVDTYWPAHSVRVDHETLVLKTYGTDLLLPFWTAGLRAGGRLENVSWNEADNGGSNILNWGEWGTAASPYEVVDALFLGTEYQGQQFGAISYAVCSKNGNRTIICKNDGNGNNFIDYMEVYATDDKFYLKSSMGDGNAVVREWPSSFTTPWRIRIKGEKNSFDVASFWWYNNLKEGYFMVQPMCSVSGEPAFFTHGYNILTEL